MSQERLAADTGVDRAYMSELERELANPTIDLLDRLASALHVGIDAFFVAPEEGAEKPSALRSGRRPKS